ncbi:MAG: hypothetical protein LBG17_02005 [Bacteroidales bacterium]|jgi:hypothetical protein|nr:hypothetical protein [Bacteroidales bacterium]
MKEKKNVAPKPKRRTEKKERKKLRTDDRMDFSLGFFQRLEQCLEIHNDKLTPLAHQLGLSGLYFVNAKRSRSVIGLDVFAMILDMYPEINPDWLMSGKGLMYRGGVDDNNQILNLLKNGNNRNNTIAAVEKIEKIEKITKEVKALLNLKNDHNE